MFNVSDKLVGYAKDTPVLRMLAHVSILTFVIVIISLSAIFVSNFSAILKFAESYTNAQNVSVEDALVVSTEVNALLEDQRASLGVDRLYVSKFHNGKVDLNGIHFIYFSRVSESTGGGISNEMNTTQSLPLSIFPDMLNHIAVGDCYFVGEIDDTVSNGMFLTDQGIQSTLVCPIWNSAGRLIGIIGADAIRGTLNTEQRDEIQAVMIPLSKVLGGLLSIKK